MVKNSELLQVRMDWLEVIEMTDDETGLEAVKCPIRVPYKLHRNERKVWRRKKGKQKIEHLSLRNYEVSPSLNFACPEFYTMNQI